jgi:DNA-binding response OmpR family regulator
MAKCLVVDDVIVTQIAVESFLDEMGIECEGAADEEEAMEALEQGGIDLVLLDWHLKKKSGLEVLAEIREKYGDRVKVIIFSGVEKGDKTEEIKQSGADAYLSKPTKKEILEAKIRELGVL